MRYFRITPRFNWLTRVRLFFDRKKAREIKVWLEECEAIIERRLPTAELDRMQAELVMYGRTQILIKPD